MTYTKKSGIYCIENNKNHKKYIGQSVSVYERWYKHINELNNNKHFNDHLQKSWNKYGSDQFSFYVLEFCDVSLLDEKEIYYINFYQTLNGRYGYNLKSGGQHSTNAYNNCIRQKMSNSLKKAYKNSSLKKKRKEDALKQWADPKIKEKISGENNYMYGRTHTYEARQKISNAKKGKPSSRRNFTPVLCIELNQIFQDATEASKILHLDSSCILKVCRGERKTCGKYHWKFIIRE